MMSLAAFACDFAVVSETGHLSGDEPDGAGTDGVDPSDSDSASSDSGATSGGGDPYEGSDTDGGETSWGDSGEQPGTSTVGPETSSGGFEPDPVPTACDGEPVELDVASLAYSWAQIPPAPDYGDTGGDFNPIDPDTLYVRLSNQAASCDGPNASPACGENWAVTIAIPPAFQAPGIYHLSGADVQGSWTQTLADEGNNECAAGAGPVDATFEIISVDDQEVKGRLCHLDTTLLLAPIDIEGSFTASRCE